MSQGKGWKNESHRHSMSARGVKTPSEEFFTPEQRNKAVKEQEEMIRRYQEVEDNYYEYLKEQMKKKDIERILDKDIDLSPTQIEHLILFGKQIQDFDLLNYKHDRLLQKLTLEEYREMQNIYASEPRITRPFHVTLARKGWVSLYDGYYDAVVPSYRAWNPNVMADLEIDRRSYVLVD